jgi:molecular chaperone GrpE
VTDRSKKKLKETAEEEETVAESAEEEVEPTLLEQAELKASEHLDTAKRVQADFENYRKRTQREMEDFRRFANESLVSDLLCILDDLERAVAMECVDAEFHGGVKGIHINLMKILEAKGLKVIPTENKFDPAIHEALCMCEGEENGKILEVYQKGYYLGQRVLRHSKVLVSKIKDIKEGE